jgi:hypothetical protein
MARMPKDVSVMVWPVSRLTSHAKTFTPRCRIASLVSCRPSRREPVTKSASPATTGPRTRPISAGSYWPSASVVTM